MTALPTLCYMAFAPCVLIPPSTLPSHAFAITNFLAQLPKLKTGFSSFYLGKHPIDFSHHTPALSLSSFYIILATSPLQTTHSSSYQSILEQNPHFYKIS